MTQYDATWDSLVSYGVPDWFIDSKFGLYAHWGLYSVPGFGMEWYGKHMYNPDHEIHKEHVKRYGSPSTFGYKDFIPQFTAEDYDPDDWAELFQKSGAKYAGFSLAHHDGFGLWDSDVYRWNVGKMGPKRDLYGELAAALRKRDLKLVAPFHIVRGFNWFLPNFSQWAETPAATQALIEQGMSDGWDLFDPQYADFYWVEQTSKFEDFLTQWQRKVREVLDKYQPDLTWFDGGKFREDGLEPVALEILAYYLNQSVAWDKRVCVLNKLPVSMKYNFHPDFGVINFESGRDRPSQFDRIWNDDMRIGDKSWGWVEDQTYSKGQTILAKLIDCVSRGGSLMLSLSPKADGTIPEGQRQSLLEVGSWLKVHGEAIYNTRQWTVHGEGDDEKLLDRSGKHVKWVYEKANADDRRYTQSKDGQTIYAMTLGIPQSSVTFEALGSVKIKSISLLGSDQTVTWQQADNGLTIDVADVGFPSDMAAAWKIEQE